MDFMKATTSLGSYIYHYQWLQHQQSASGWGARIICPNVYQGVHFTFTAMKLKLFYLVYRTQTAKSINAIFLGPISFSSGTTLIRTGDELKQSKFGNTNSCNIQMPTNIDRINNHEQIDACVSSKLVPSKRNSIHLSLFVY